MTHQLVLLAGGLATRLGNRTASTPKSLIEINGRKFIDYQLAHFSLLGFKRILICVGHFGEQIIDFVGDGSRWNLIVEYSEEKEAQLGTGGALKLALPMLDEKFCVVYGDSYLLANLGKISREIDAMQENNVMTIYKNVKGSDKSNVEYFSNFDWQYSKQGSLRAPEYIDYGFLLLTRKGLDDYACESPWDLSHYLEYLNSQRNLTPYIVADRYFEIGSEGGLLEFQKFALTSQK